MGRTIYRLSVDGQGRRVAVARGRQPIVLLPRQAAPVGRLTRIAGRSVYIDPDPPVDRSTLVPGTYLPDASTAGVIGAGTWTPLSTVNTAVTYATNGQTINRVLFTEKVSVAAKDVTFTNCRFLGPNGPTPQAAVQCTNAAVENLVLQDCDITQQNPIWDSPGIKGHHFTLRRCHIWNCQDGIAHIGVGSVYTGVNQGITIESSWIEKMSYMSPDPGASGGLPDNASHCDGMQLRGGDGIRIRGNRFDGFVSDEVGQGNILPVNLASGTHVTGNKYATVSDPSMQSTSCLMCSPVLGAFGDLMIEENWFDGGAFMINMGAHTTGGITIRNNRVGYNARTTSNGGGGPNSFVIANSALPITLTGNVRPDTGAAANYRKNG
jgi:hypothetical protein